MHRRYAMRTLFGLAATSVIAPGCGGGDQGPATEATPASDSNVEEETRAADEAMQKAALKSMRKGGH